MLRGTLADIADQMHEAKIIISDLLAAEGFADRYLYLTAPCKRAPIDAEVATERHL